MESSPHFNDPLLSSAVYNEFLPQGFLVVAGVPLDDVDREEGALDGLDLLL